MSTLATPARSSARAMQEPNRKRMKATPRNWFRICSSRSCKCSATAHGVNGWGGHSSATFALSEPIWSRRPVVQLVSLPRVRAVPTTVATFDEAKGLNRAYLRRRSLIRSESRMPPPANDPTTSREVLRRSPMTRQRIANIFTVLSSLGLILDELDRYRTTETRFHWGRSSARPATSRILWASTILMLASVAHAQDYVATKHNQHARSCVFVDQGAGH